MDTQKYGIMALDRRPGQYGRGHIIMVQTIITKVNNGYVVEHQAAGTFIAPDQGALFSFLGQIIDRPITPPKIPEKAAKEPKEPEREDL